MIAFNGTTNSAVAEAGQPAEDRLSTWSVTNSSQSAAHTIQKEEAGYAITKRLMDFIGAVLMLVVGFPLFLVVGIAIKCSSRGPILFRQQRLGLNGNLFWCMKFRTMVCDAEDQLKKNEAMRSLYQQGGYKMKNDPRVTRIGAFLRKTSLDELPQLFNVLVGEMSLIGPRPIIEREIAEYGEYGTKLLTVKPGLGGMWQASGRSEVDYPERVVLDMSYIDNRSLLLDVTLLLKTALSVCRSHGAY